MVYDAETMMILQNSLMVVSGYNTMESNKRMNFKQ